MLKLAGERVGDTNGFLPPILNFERATPVSDRLPQTHPHRRELFSKPGILLLTQATAPDHLGNGTASPHAKQLRDGICPPETDERPTAGSRDRVATSQRYGPAA